MWMKHDQVQPVLNLLNTVDPHIKFVIEAQGHAGSILLLDTNSTPGGNGTTQVSVYRKTTHMQTGT